MNHRITSQLVVAYFQCPRKAFFIFHGEPKASQHEFEKVSEDRRADTRSIYLAGLPRDELETSLQRADGIGDSALVCADDLVATCDALVRKGATANKSHARYEPHLVVGTVGISKEQKLALAFAGHVVGKEKRYAPESGYVVPFEGRPRSVRLSSLYSQIRSIIAGLRVILNEPKKDAPSLTLIDHCSVCPFRVRCQREAEQTDNLTLLDRMTPKLVSRYAAKGVFTVNQLSYLFKPKRYRKRPSAAKTLFSITLQALAIRTGNPA